jgi:hypothetical protein
MIQEIKMRSGWMLISLACLLAACGGATPTPEASAVPIVPTAATLSGFRILSPAAEAVVNVPEVEVIGEAKPETVITLNDEIVVVDESGTFSVTLPLEEGLNVIEVVASDPQGHETSLELEVTYDPES